MVSLLTPEAQQVGIAKGLHDTRCCDAGYSDQGGHCMSARACLLTFESTGIFLNWTLHFEYCSPIGTDDSVAEEEDSVEW